MDQHYASSSFISSKELSVTQSAFSYLLIVLVSKSAFVFLSIYWISVGVALMPVKPSEPSDLAKRVSAQSVLQNSHRYMSGSFLRGLQTSRLRGDLLVDHTPA